jgi:hypothetical protein
LLAARRPTELLGILPHDRGGQLQSDADAAPVIDEGALGGYSRDDILGGQYPRHPATSERFSFPTHKAGLSVFRSCTHSFDGVIPEIDIWRAANLMLKRYGEKALEESAARADEVAADGDHNGVAVWRRIADAVTQLTNKIPPGPVHQPAGKGSPIDCNPLDLVRRDLAPVWS